MSASLSHSPKIGVNFTPFLLSKLKMIDFLKNISFSELKRKRLFLRCYAPPLCLSPGAVVSLSVMLRQTETRRAGRRGVKKNPKNGRICIAADLSNVDICQHLQHRSGVLFSSWCTCRGEMCVGGQKEPIHLVGFEEKRNQKLNLIL